MGIEPILSAWKAEVLAIIRMAHISAPIEKIALYVIIQIYLLLVPIFPARLGVEPSPFASEAAVFFTTLCFHSHFCCGLDYFLTMPKGLGWELYSLYTFTDYSDLARSCLVQKVSVCE